MEALTGEHSAAQPLFREAFLPDHYMATKSIGYLSQCRGGRVKNLYFALNSIKQLQSSTNKFLQWQRMMDAYVYFKLGKQTLEQYSIRPRDTRYMEIFIYYLQKVHTVFGKFFIQLQPPKLYTQNCANLDSTEKCDRRVRGPHLGVTEWPHRPVKHMIRNEILLTEHPIMSHSNQPPYSFKHIWIRGLYLQGFFRLLITVRHCLRG